jgi:radical SAM protein with 4Fe4S-binding SPASM domain
MPFNSLEISPEGTCQVCCKIRKVIRKDELHVFNILEDKLNNIWNSDDVNRLRQQFLAGEKPEECVRCWTEEEAGIFSLRQQNKYNNRYSVDKPVVNYLSLKLSNKCNLACRICSPYLSSLWQTQYNKLNIPLLPSDYYETVSLDKFEGERLQALHDMSVNLEYLLIYGGEPLINDEVLDYIKFLVDSKLAKNISLTLNTNGTVYTDELIELLNQFKRINLFLSIDDIGTRFEYQRWPAKWNKIDENIKKYAVLPAPFHIGIYPTASILNILNLEELLNGLHTYGCLIMFANLIHDPQMLCLKNLPVELKQKLIEVPSIEKFGLILLLVCLDLDLS